MKAVTNWLSQWFKKKNEEEDNETMQYNYQTQTIIRLFSYCDSEHWGSVEMNKNC